MIIQINLDKVRQEKEMKIIECLCLQASSIRKKTSTAWVTEENYEIQRFYIKKKSSLTAAGQQKNLEHVIMQCACKWKG